MSTRILAEQVDEKLASILQNFHYALQTCDYKYGNNQLKTKLIVEQERLAMANSSNNIVQSVESLISLTGLYIL